MAGPVVSSNLHGPNGVVDVNCGRELLGGALVTGARITDVRAYLVENQSAGGDYHDRPDGHWIVDSAISTPMSAYPRYRRSRASFGINVMSSILVEIETDQGAVGVSAGQGGVPACYMIEEHFKRFLVDQDPRCVNLLWDQMFRASLYYGGSGLPLWAISAVDLALWDLLGHLRGEPVYQMIGGAVREEIPLYCTGVRPDLAQTAGFIGGKVPLPYGPGDRLEGLRRNCEIMQEHRGKVGPEFPLMVDCWMSLDVPYAIDLANALQDVRPYWIEEALPPYDVDGLAVLKQRVPWVRWASGEHEYTRYGFRKLIESRAVDVVQPDLMWCGGLTEMLRISALAASYDLPIVPHGSGVYGYHFGITQPHCSFMEYINPSPDCETFPPVFGDMFTDEIPPEDGRAKLSNAPGWGLKLNRAASSLVRPFHG